jgi:hypothetical protein
MGWSGGSVLMSKVIRAVQAEVPDDDARRRIYKPLIRAFEDDDCDTLYECKGKDPAFDKALGRRR